MSYPVSNKAQLWTSCSASTVMQFTKSTLACEECKIKYFVTSVCIFLNRAPIVARCDRKRVLSSWAPFCGNLTPKEFEVEFSQVRYLTPQQFVERLAVDLGVCGVVAGAFPLFV